MTVKDLKELADIVYQAKYSGLDNMYDALASVIEGMIFDKMKEKSDNENPFCPDCGGLKDKFYREEKK